MKLFGIRDFNIVSNRYLQHHNEKIQANDDIMRAEAASKYWGTHNYDPLLAKYFDNKKEEEFLKARDAEAKIHGQDQVKKLPQTV